MRNELLNLKKAYYVSAPCGSGKTLSLCHHIKADRERNILYVAPSVDLVNETRERLEVMGVHADVITTETHPKKVRRALTEYFEAAEDVGNLLLVTHKAYFGLPFFANRNNWSIFIDEIPQVTNPHTLEIPHHKDLLLKHVDVMPWKTDGLYILQAINRFGLRKLLDGPRDQINDQFRGLFENLVSENYITFIDKMSWEKLTSDKVFERKEEKKNRIYCVSMLNHKPFRRATILGANIERSLIRKWLESTYRIQFEEQTELVAGLLPIQPVGPRLRLRYFVPERNFSKYLAGLVADDGQCLIDKMDDLARKELEDTPFLLFCNNDRKKAYLKRLGPNATWVSTYCYGLNTYKGFTQAYFSAAINFAPQHIRMLTELGLGPDDIHNSVAYETAYQAIMRSALRDPTSDAIVTAIVADQRTAEAIARITGCTDVAQIGDLIQPKPLPFDGSQKKQRQEYHRILKLLTEPNSLPKPSLKENGVINGPSNIDSLLSDEELVGTSLEPVFMTLHRSQYDKRPDQFYDHERSIGEWIGLFRSLARGPIDDKEQHLMFTPARFIPPVGAEGYRRKEYLTSVSCLVLDFDSGTLRPDDFIRLFGDTATLLKLSFMIMNSFSRSSEEPNRFRVVIFYSRPITGQWEEIWRIHKNAVRFIESLLEDAGVPPSTSGLDKQCYVANQPYWAPCTNRHHPEYRLFETHNTKTHQLLKHAIDPIIFDYPENALVFESAIPMCGTVEWSGERKRDIIDAVSDNLRGMAENRRVPILNAGIVLVKQAGLSHNEVQQVLMDAVGQEKHLRRHVTETMKWLKVRRIMPKI